MEEINPQPPALDYANPVPQPERAPVLPAPEPRLSADHLRQLTDAKSSLKKIRRAVSVARFDGWTIAIFAILTIVVGYSSFWGLTIGAVMAVSAYLELRSADKLSRLDISSIKILSLNQVGLASLLIVYALWSFYTFDATAASASSELAQLGVSAHDLAETERLIFKIMYGGVILVAIFGQGGLALYYAGKRKLLREYLEETPEWIVAMQKAGIAN